MKTKELFQETPQGKPTQKKAQHISKEDLPRLRKEAEMYAKFFNGLAHYYEALEIVADSKYYYEAKHK